MPGHKKKISIMKKKNIKEILLNSTSYFEGNTAKNFQIDDLKVRSQLNKPAAQAAGAELPDATPPIGKSSPFSKMAIALEPVMRLCCPSRSIIS